MAKAKLVAPMVDPKAEAIQLLRKGAINVEVAKQTGLSKDQIYRLKKKNCE